MFETPGWSSSRDEEIHKAAGNVQLRKYGQFFSRLSRTWWEPSSTLDHVLEGPIRLVYRITESESLLSLSEMENKHLSKILATVAGTCREIRALKSEFPDLYSKILYNSEKNHQDNYSGLFGDLQDLSVFCNRISSVIHLAIEQLSSLTKTSNEIYLPAMIEQLIDLFVILVTLDEVVEAHQTLQESWRKYRIQVRTVMHNPQKFSLPENRLVTFDELLKDLHAQLFTRNLFLRAVEGVMNISKTPLMNDHLLSYLRNIFTEVETKILSPHLISRNVVRTNVGIVLSTKLFGVCDKKLQKRVVEINKKIYAVALVGNVLWVPSRFLSETLPKDFANSCVTPQVGEKLLAAMIQKLPQNYGSIVHRSMIWCMDARNLLSDSEFQIQDIKKQYSLLKQVVGLFQQINEVVFTVTNLHAELSKPMTRGTVQIICRLVEMQKTLESTLRNLGPNIVQAQGRSLQCLSYEILLILESARKGLVQKDQGYSRERLDALSLMNLAMKLIDTTPSSDRRLIARCALTISRQLSDTFKDEDAVNLKQKLDDFDTIADLDSIISEACDYSVLIHYQNMIPAYLTSVSEGDQDVSHVLHLLNAFNSAVIKIGRSEVTEAKVKDLKESLIKNILEPACREIETSLRLHVHAHLKLDSANPFKIGVKDGGRIVRSSPLPIASSLISSKRFIEHYLDDMFYNLTTVALHDWRTYRTMHTLAKYKLGLETVQNHLPTQTLEQGLDALEIMRNISVFVSKYLYNLNTQTFVEHTSANKHLNTIGIRHIANSIRTHGTGIMSTTVNFVYQFLRVKLHTFSQFLFDEHIKSRLLRDIRFIRSQRERDEVPYTYERAEKFQKGIRKLGMSAEGLSYLDHFRQLITQIGTALGYVRLIRSGGLHASANAVSFLPEIKSSARFESACESLEYSATTKAAAKRLDDDIGNLVRNFTEGIQYFKLLVDVFASAFRDPKSFHLQQFYAIIPPLTLSFVDNAVANKEKIFKKNKDGAAFTDDGFAMGVAYVNALLDQDAELDGLQWFETVNGHFNLEKTAAEVRADGGDEKLQQTKALTLKRIAQRTAEFQLLYYSLSGARVFFKQPEA
ncbi:WASH complex subunit 4 isoform X2 [Diachasma alloeum]|uniref:WASH complex subunit 4 isoform X1 n=1 Tax=Diachasma alloeum TaxID=454923 RepID=UPI00073844C4|nr:WASH complex subunit 4 isoform X1 [Diachasma alloeum]XP_015111381.1 WASH complex subunit 4 isoform X2 [Diachasma alloeum]